MYDVINFPLCVLYPNYSATFVSEMSYNPVMCPTGFELAIGLTALTLVLMTRSMSPCSTTQGSL
jgi:hypothetical protein